MALSKEQKAKNRVRDDVLCALIGKPKGWDLNGKKNTLEALALIRDKLGGRFTYEGVTYHFQQRNKNGKRTLEFGKCDDKGRKKVKRITEGDYDNDPEGLKHRRQLVLEDERRRRDINEERTGTRRNKGSSSGGKKDEDVKKFEFMNECQEQSKNGEADTAMDRFAELGDFPTSFRHDHPNRKSFWHDGKYWEDLAISFTSAVINGKLIIAATDSEGATLGSTCYYYDTAVVVGPAGLTSDQVKQLVIENRAEKKSPKAWDPSGRNHRTPLFEKFPREYHQFWQETCELIGEAGFLLSWGGGEMKDVPQRVKDAGGEVVPFDGLKLSRYMMDLPSNGNINEGHPFYEYRHGISLGIGTLKRVFCPHIKGKHHESHVDAGVARDFSIKLALAIERRRNGTNASSLRGWTRPAPFSVPLEESKYQQYQQRENESRKGKRRGGKPGPNFKCKGWEGERIDQYDGWDLGPDEDAIVDDS